MQILYNARIHTLDPDQPLVTAIATETGTSSQAGRGRVLAVGSDRQVLAQFEGIAHESAAVTDLEGRTILPGLTDAHIHLETYALGLQKVDCETATRQECLQRVADRARTPRRGMDSRSWLEPEQLAGGFGSAGDDCDQAAPDHPVYLTAKSLHAAWVNRAALRRAGLWIGRPTLLEGDLARRSHGVGRHLVRKRDGAGQQAYP